MATTRLIKGRNTSSFVRRHINSLARAQIFTTSDLLLYGTRAAVDHIMARLVKELMVIRLARGVFVRAYQGFKWPSCYEIALAKARAFKREITSHGQDDASNLNLADRGNIQPTYLCNGSSSCFKYRDMVIHFQRASARKMKLPVNNLGAVIKALWHLGKKQATAELANKIPLLRDERKELRHSAALMPNWLRSLWTYPDRWPWGPCGKPMVN